MLWIYPLATEPNPSSLRLFIVHITPVLKNKMDANASPLCWKCNSETGDYIHCLWSCVKLRLYWFDIVNECY